MKTETRILRTVTPENGGPRIKRVLIGLAERYGGGGEDLVDRMIADGQLVRYSSKRGSRWGLPKQAGFTLVELAIVLAIVGTLAALALAVRGWWVEYTDGLIAQGRQEIRLQVEQRDRKELQDAQVQIIALQLERDTLAALQAEEQARAKRKHDQEVANEKAKTAELQRRIAAGELVYVDPGRTGAVCPGQQHAPGDRGSGASASAPAAAGGSGQAVSQGLSREAAAFLLSEADRADEVARDLELCWSIARDDRRKMRPGAWSPSR